jgi:hypothetical protein
MAENISESSEFWTSRRTSRDNRPITVRELFEIVETSIDSVEKWVPKRCPTNKKKHEFKF